MRKKLFTGLIILVVLFIGLFSLNSESVCAADSNKHADDTIIEIPQKVWVNPIHANEAEAENVKTGLGIQTFAEPVYKTNHAEIGLEIQEIMLERERDIVIYYKTEHAYEENWYDDLIEEWVLLACGESENPVAGDYLYWHLSSYTYGGSIRTIGTTYYYTIPLSFEYYTSLEQEQIVSEKVEEIITELNFEDVNISDYDKIKSIYDYITGSVVYDYEHLNDDSYGLKYSAYAALINKTAVCQGYANLLYRLLKECNIDSRIVYGIGNGGEHAWNIINIGDLYYFADATWDAGRNEYSYFLRGTEDFGDHEAISTFLNNYDIPDRNYYETLLHDYEISEFENSTCSKNGYIKYVCSICQDEYTETLVLAEHIYEEWYVEKEATYTEKGLEKRNCVNCDHFETKVVDKISIATGWKQINGIWYYYNSNGTVTTGWSQIGGTWYYFKSSGAMATGWQSIGGTWYYLKASGAMATGWQSIGGTWYYFKSSGAMVTGWQSIGGTWYYFKSSGAMVTGWQQIGSTWYYFKSSGAMATGWQLIGGTWYYLKSSGAMVTGWQSIGNTWYYFKSSGAMATGWLQINGTWYYFNSSGAWVS